MMKKIISLTLALLLVLCVAACDAGSNQEGTNPTVGNITEKPTESKPTEGKNTEPTNTSDEGEVWKVPGSEIYASYPSEWLTVDRGRVLMVLKDKKASVNLTYSKDEIIEGDIENMIAPMTTSTVNNIYPYCEGSIEVSVVDVETSTKCKVAGFDGLKFLGTISSKGEYDCHVYGYVCNVDGVCVMVCGMVTAKDQDPSLIAEIDALTDQIAASIRTEK